MGSIISWVRGNRGWVRSPYGDLPVLRVDDAQVHQTWLILAGGIALILSRASRSELESRFAAARHVHAIARARLAKKRLPKPDPELLRAALKEIANLADPMTREAGRECLARATERSSRKAGTGAPVSSSAPRSTASAVSVATSEAAAVPATAAAAAATAAPVSAPDEHEPTQLDLDLLFERSNRLRGTVAWARSTTFGPDT